LACVYFTATSLDGFIVDDPGSLDWPTSRAIDVDGPFGSKAFETGVGALVMDSPTYEWLLANEPGEWMYSPPSRGLTYRRGIVGARHPVQLFSGAVLRAVQPGLRSARLAVAFRMDAGRGRRQRDFVCARWRVRR
jgi:dihydrofolate reductase